MGSPLIVEDRVYISDEDGDIAIFKVAKEQEKIAEINMESAVYTTPLAANKTLFIANRNRIYALEEGARRKATKASSTRRKPLALTHLLNTTPASIKPAFFISWSSHRRIGYCSVGDFRAQWHAKPFSHYLTQFVAGDIGNTAISEPIVHRRSSFTETSAGHFIRELAASSNCLN